MHSSAPYEGLLPVERSDEPPPIRPTTLENERFPNERPSLRNRASRALSRFLFAFCAGVAATLAWLSYGDATRQMIANSYPLLGWLAPRNTATDTIALAGSAVRHPDQGQLDAMLGDLHAMRLSLDRIAAGQELITRGIDEIAARIAAGQEQITRSTDQTATGIAAGQEPTTRSTSQTAATIATGQEQMTRTTEQTATSIDQAETTGIPAQSRGDAASLQPPLRLKIKPTAARPPQTLSETGKQSSATSWGHDVSCFPSASAVLQNHPGGWPTWTLRAPGHEGTMCWYAAARPRTRDHRSEIAPRKETIGTPENGLSALPPPYTRPPE